MGTVAGIPLVVPGLQQDRQFPTLCGWHLFYADGGVVGGGGGDVTATPSLGRIEYGWGNWMHQAQKRTKLLTQ